MKVLVQFGCIGALALLAAPAADAGGRWISLTKGGLELYTNAGERDGRQTLEQFDRIRRGFAAIGGAGRIQPLPVRILLFRSLKDYRPFQPAESTAAFFQSGPERDYIVMHAASGGPLRAACHEYAHLALSHSTVPLPQWLEEGLAEFYSTLESGDGTTSAGRPIAAHLYTLGRSEWLDGRSLLSVTRDSPQYNETSKTGVFYAESWALVHMLMLAEPYGGRMGRFLTLIGQGAPQESALDQAFGKGIDELISDCRGHLETGLTRRLEWPGQEQATGAARPFESPLSDAKVHLAAAEVLTLMGRWKEALQRLQAAAKQMPGAPQVETALGIVALRQRHYVRARQHLEWAISGGSQDAATYFEYAMLLRETRGSREEVEKNLRRALELNPNYAEAHFMLAVLLTAAGKAGEAIPHLERANAILPRQAYFWQALAVAYSRTGRKADAHRAAGRALSAAQTRHEVEMAQAANSILEDSGGPTQRSLHVEGRLEQIDCLGQAARLHLVTGDGRLALLVRSPGEILMKHPSSMAFHFRCGPQNRTAITVEYTSLPDAPTRTAGEVTSIEFPAQPAPLAR